MLLVYGAGTQFPGNIHFNPRYTFRREVFTNPDPIHREVIHPGSDGVSSLVVASCIPELQVGEIGVPPLF
jgi:hypothetical protein